MDAVKAARCGAQEWNTSRPVPMNARQILDSDFARLSVEESKADEGLDDDYMPDIQNTQIPDSDARTPDFQPAAASAPDNDTSKSKDVSTCFPSHVWYSDWSMARARREAEALQGEWAAMVRARARPCAAGSS